ncbi:MAG: DUF4838 domain-containing protein [Armatimonadia bacterium]
MPKTLCLLAALLLALPVAALTIAEKGQARLVVVLPDAPAGEEKEAAAEFGKYLAKVTSATFEMVAEKDLAARPAIYVGATKAAAAAGISADKLDRDGFIIKAAGGSLYLIGNDATATELAVHYFLQRYGGVRWYIPLEIGEYIPQKPTFTVSDTLNDVQEPDWRSRLWSSVANMDPMWAKRNLCRPRYEFHHNLLNALKPSEVYDKHPEWFPLIDGKRIPKPPDGAHSWQPCFANREMAQYLGAKIIKYFDEHPTATSYSLGINDVGEGGYCQCADCQALDDKRQPTFRDRPNYSNRVFTMMNRVAEITSQKYPDKLLGCLSYANCEAVPTFAVHPNIIPYLTNDRAQWRDQGFKAVDQKLLRQWAKATRQLGVYDYYYGSGYVIPRFFPAVSAESIKFCHKTGVRAWYAEIYSNWGLDGCKAWLASQLLWDVNQDPKKLVDEYYTNFFGAAKVPMKKYWDRCEQIWMKQPGKAVWFKGFFNLDQLEMFPPKVCDELRGYLDQAQKLADTDLIRKRVQLYSDGFRYTELYARVYWGDKAFTQAKVANMKQADALVRELVGYAEASAGLQTHFTKVINADPLLKPVLPFDAQARGTFGNGVLPALSKLADFYEANKVELPDPPCLSKALPADNPVAKMYTAYMTLRQTPDAGIELLPNPGFEAGLTGGKPQGADWKAEGCPPGWSSWIRGGTQGDLRWVKEPVHAGQYAVMITKVSAAACYLTTAPIVTGDVYLCTVYAKGKVAKPEHVQLQVKWRDKENKWFEAAPQAALLPGSELKDWTPLQVMFTAPPGAAQAVIMMVSDKLDPGDVVYFDDCSLKRVNLK